MPIRNPPANEGKETTSTRIPRLNRKQKRAYLTTGPASSPNVTIGPTSPVMSEQGAIELQGSEVPASMAEDAEARRESASTANGSTTANSVRTSTNGADPNLSTLAIKSPTFSAADSLFPENNGLNPNNNPTQSLQNRFNSVQSATCSPTETGSFYSRTTSGRSRHSAFIPSSFTNLWRSSSTITPPRKATSDITLSAIDRVTDSGPTVSTKQSTLAPKTGPDEAPQSFFDSDSDSDSERYQSPILSQAQTSSVARPSLVEHKSSVRISPRNIIGLRTAAASPGPSMSKASQVLGTDFKSLHDLTPAVQKDDPLKSHPVERHPSRLVPSMHGAAVANNYARHESVSAASTDTHDFADGDVPSPALSFVSSSIVEGPPHDDGEALDTMPSPRAGLDGLHPPPTLHSQQLHHQTIDGLANPGSVKRTASAPPLRRVVRINTDDVVVKMGPGGKRFHRESVVSTPYPTRNPSLQDPPALLHSTPSTTDRISPTADPFPNTAAPALPSLFEKIASRKQDTLILCLSVASHPLLTRTIAIPLNPPPTSNTLSYDDAHLFATLRKEYHALIGSARCYLTARTFASVAYHGPGSFSEFDGIDFLEHFCNSSLGHRRRKWVLWARRIADRSHPHPHYPATPQPDSAIPHRGSATTRQDSMWDDIELAATYPPVPPLPRLEFSHRFSVTKIAFAVLATFIAAAAAVLLWTLLGLPRAVTGPFGPFEGSLGLGFRDSGARLQTGLVFGVTVLLFGLAGVGSWVGGSWVVL